MEVAVPSPQGMPPFLAGHPDLLAAYLTCLERKEVKSEHLPPELSSDGHVIHSNVRPVRCKLPLAANILSSPSKTLSTVTVGRQCTPVSSNHEQHVAAGNKSNDALSSSTPSRDKPKLVESSSAKKNSSLPTKPSAPATQPSTARKNNSSVSSLANSKPAGPSNDKAATFVPNTQKKTTSTTLTSPAKARTGGKQSANIPLPVSSTRSGVAKQHGASIAKTIARQVSKHLDGKDVANKKTSAAAEVTEVDVEKVAEPTLASVERVAALSSVQKTTSPIGIVPRRAQRSTTYAAEKEHGFHSRASRTNTVAQSSKLKTLSGEKSHSKILPTKAASTHRFNSGGVPEVVEVRKQRKGDEIELIVLDNENQCSTQAQKAIRIRGMLESNVGRNSPKPNNAKATSSSTDKTTAEGNSHLASRTGSLNGGVSRSSHSITKNRSARSVLSKVRTEHLMIARTRAGAAETSQSIELSQPTPPRPNYGLSQDRNDIIIGHGLERTRQSSRLSQDRNHASVDLTDTTRQSSRLSQGRSEDSRRRGNSSSTRTGGRAQTSSQNKTGGSNKSKPQPSRGQKQASPSSARTSGSQAQRAARGHKNQNLIGNARRKNNTNNNNNGWKKNSSPKHAKTGPRKGKVQTTLNLSANNKSGRSEIIMIDETSPRTSPGQHGVSKSSRVNINRRRERLNNGNKESMRGNGRDGNRGRSVKKNLAVVDLCSD